IVTASTPGVTAVKRATETIPIVFATVGDAVAVGIVASLARPGGNATGASYFTPQLNAKRLELLKEAVPTLARAGVLFNPENPASRPVLPVVRETAQQLRIELFDVAVREPAAFRDAFAAIEEKRVEALVVSEDPMLIRNAAVVASLALEHRIP